MSHSKGVTLQEYEGISARVIYLRKKDPPTEVEQWDFQNDT